MKEELCVWRYDDYCDYYGTSCGETFCFVDGTLANYETFSYCPYCGKKIVEKEAKNE